MATTTDRKKVNYMIDRDVFNKIEQYVPAGKRSDFVNEALNEAIIQYGRRKASEEMDKLRKKAKISMTTEEFIKLKNYGRP